jgi:hypothetical protein
MSHWFTGHPVLHLDSGPLPVERGNVLQVIGFEVGCFCNGKQLSKLRKCKDKSQEASLPVCFVHTVV